MARLASVAKAGFFPTLPEIVKMISSFIQAEEPVGRLLDPCSGTGDALAQIAHGLHVDVKTYGVELDKERARQAKSVLTKVVDGDLFRVRAKKGSFSFMLLNPPYHQDPGENKRFEHTFLTISTPYLQTGGVLAYLIPQKRLSKRIARYLASWYQQFIVYRFPGKSYESFGQIVLFATKKPKSFLDETAYARLTMVPETVLKELYAKEKPVYTIPKNTVDDKSFYFRSLDLNMEELQKEVEAHGAWEQVKQMMYPPMEDVKGKVLMPLRKGHLAILIACGLCNGILEKNGKRLLIKGIAKKEQIVTTEHDGDTVIEKSTDIIKIGIRAINLKTGELINIE
jgi:predicted RNA methylase